MLYHHLPQGMGHGWEAWKCCLVFHWLSTERKCLLSLREIGSSTIYRQRVMVKDFSFSQTVIPIGCISNLVEDGLVIVHLACWRSWSFNALFADRTNVSLSWCWISFSVKVQAWLYQIFTQRYNFRNLCFCKLLIYHQVLPWKKNVMIH